MKRLKGKRGFTLVECVVAMAVLMIMSLLLTMLLNITLVTRNQNIEYEKSLDGQVNNIAAENEGAKSSPYAEDVEFSSGDKTFSIPGNGNSYSKANKKYYEGENEIGIVDYNFENYFANLPQPEDLGGGDAGNPTNRGEIGGKVGETNILNSSGASSVNITPSTTVNYKYQVEVDDEGNPKKDASGKPIYAKDADGNLIPEKDAEGNPVIEGYTINMNVGFTAYYVTPERSLKIILPIGAEYVGCSSATDCMVDNSSRFTVRIQPGGNRIDGGYSSENGKGGYVEAGRAVSANFSFMISKEDYDNFYQDHGMYFKGSSSPDGTTMGITL